MRLHIALAGNPNCGKTTLFNALTGAKQYVGNWPGVTVEKKAGKLRNHPDVEITDLPGIYSMSPYTLEEVVTRDYLLHERPDAIINIIDGSNLERNLYLTTQLMELSIPVVVAVNRMDILEKNGDVIDIKKLSRLLGCPVVAISALKGSGLEILQDEALQLAGKSKTIPAKPVFDGVVEHAIAHIETHLEGIIPEAQERWTAIKLFERDDNLSASLNLAESIQTHINEHIVEAETALDDDSESIIINERYNYIAGLVAACSKPKKREGLSTSDKIDQIVTNRYFGLPIFAAIMFMVYYVSVTSVGTLVTDFTNDTLFGEWIIPGVGGFLAGIGTAAWLQGLIVDGIVSGVGAVLGFVPQILVLFIFLAILEECGYMSRVAFLLDRVFRRFGLSGKSFIPMIISTGCGVPGVMATRTIEQDRDRRMTIMTTTFMPCGAKLPIIALIAGALLGGAWWAAPSAYFIGIAAIVISGIILKKTRPFQGDPAPFVMELPAYQWPLPKAVLSSMWERGWSFIKKAGTVILLSTIFIWFASSFGWTEGQFGAVEDFEGSILGAIGGAIAWIFIPLGFGNAKAAVATMLGLVAKENVVATFGILYGFAEVSEAGNEIWTRMALDYTALAGFSFLVFNLLCAPCFAAIGAIKSEMKSAKWTFFAIAYQTTFAYVIALIIYQVGLFFMGMANPLGLAAAIFFLVLLGYLLFRPDQSTPVPTTTVKGYVREEG